MNFQLELNEAQFILNVLAQLPTQSNAYPLWVKLSQQYQAQQPAPEAPAADPAPAVVPGA
jgi:hypothetical protein